MTAIHYRIRSATSGCKPWMMILIGRLIRERLFQKTQVPDLVINNLLFFSSIDLCNYGYGKMSIFLVYVTDRVRRNILKYYGIHFKWQPHFPPHLMLMHSLSSVFEVSLNTLMPTKMESCLLQLNKFQVVESILKVWDNCSNCGAVKNRGTLLSAFICVKKYQNVTGLRLSWKVVGCHSDLVAQRPWEVYTTGLG